MGFVLWETEGPPECLEEAGVVFGVSFGSVFGAGGSGGVGVFSLVVVGLVASVFSSFVAGGGTDVFFLRWSTRLSG